MPSKSGIEKTKLEEIQQLVDKTPCNTGLNPCPCTVCCIRDVLAGKEPRQDTVFDSTIAGIHAAVDQFVNTVQQERQIARQLKRNHDKLQQQAMVVRNAIGHDKWDEIVAVANPIGSTCSEPT